MAILASLSNAGCFYIHLRMIYLLWDCSSFPNWNLHLMKRFRTSEKTQVKKQPPEFQKQFSNWKFCILKLVWQTFSFHGWGDWGLEECIDFCSHSCFMSFLSIKIWCEIMIRLILLLLYTKVWESKVHTLDE